jgi:uncharacterized protein (DUF433 family)
VHPGNEIRVSLVVSLVANGLTTEQILAEYPDLDGEDVRQALRYVASLAAEEVHPLSGTTP